ncbi:MAG TPA: endopeptidase La [Clostridiaceae bacterium]|jgi:ATP-dependent Lon protease|nr:endopeptidase La [Clostridiaceae bacterium]
MNDNRLDNVHNANSNYINKSDNSVLPLMSLRGLVVYPNTEVTFDVGRRASIAAVNEAIRRDSLIFLATQRDGALEEPTENDIYTVGTVCMIYQNYKYDDGKYKVVLKGLYKARLKKIVTETPFYLAEVEVLEDEIVPISRRDYAEALKKHAIQIFREYRQYVEKTHSFVVSGFSFYEDLDISRLTYEMANQLSVEVNKKQAILEESNVIKRLELLVSYIGHENEIMSLMMQIGSKVNQKLNKLQKDMFLREQIKAIKSELGEDDESEIDLYERRLQEKKYPKEVVEKLRKEIQRVSRMAGSLESQMIKTYIETVLDLPWMSYSRENKDLAKAAEILDRDHYGMQKVKDRILEFLAVRLTKKSPSEPILCLYGPPGVGKTSIARSIAEALGKKYVRIALGGVRDEADIRGHRRTYVGALPGRIIAAIKQVGKSNPVMLLDEIDKVGADHRGDPSSALLEALDGEQNSTFRDHYLELPYDLSRVLFIATANNLDTIPPALLDRMEIIEVPSYTEDEKFEIARRHLIPKQLAEHGLTSKKVYISDEILRSIITEYTAESGVRELERNIAAVLRKSVKIMTEDKTRKITIDEKLLVEMLGASSRKRDKISDKDEVGIANGLAWTAFGGVTMAVEVNILPGSGNIELTGRLGDVMKESARIAISYIRSRADKLGIDKDFYKNNDVHIHVPEGATPKDGPSAGITMATAIISALTGIPVKSTVAMTGEITLRGKVLPIGGLREKTLAALRSGVKTVIIPDKNRNMEPELPEAVRNELEIVYVSHMDEVLDVALSSSIREKVRKITVDSYNTFSDAKYAIQN